ncbi:MAG: class I SAM-dependent methyltransferase [Anaerolineales bacterium]|jgi:2-polyprenyl-3-methyl-5-hydroxy-6-metoxy-1,4-benzoquinol methylase
MDEKNRKLNEEGRLLWDQKAEFWDNLHGEQGNRWHQELISPAVERLLALTPGEQVLDIACGSGVLARRLAELGGVVTAADFSPELIERAKARGQSGGEPIRYSVVDATDEEALAGLGEGQFDAVTNTMALMDMPVIAPLFRAVRRLLKPAGRFVFSTSHPAFNSNNPVLLAEMEDVEGELVLRNSLKITAYNDIPPTRGMGAKNEPTSHYYYHRPLHELLGEAFDAGLVLDGLEEPVFNSDGTNEEKPLSWYSYSQIPPILVGRLRVG